MSLAREYFWGFTDPQAHGASRHRAPALTGSSRLVPLGRIGPFGPRAIVVSECLSHRVPAGP
jgi:hypothetical protein